MHIASLRAIFASYVILIIMPRYKLIIEYDGTPFCGWQWQDNGPSVQQTLEEAIARFAGHCVRLSCAGRTDSGVHALNQVAHVDLEKTFPPETVRDATNNYLRKKHRPVQISVLQVDEVANTFDARHSAIRRYYRYRILNRRAPSPLLAMRVWHIPRLIDVSAMKDVCSVLIGQHDFTTFRASHCQAKSPVKTLDHLMVENVGDEIHITAHARSFLHHQVRSITGGLVQVGAGRWTRTNLKMALEACDRTQCPGMAPAHGLYLTGVDYL